MGYPGVVFTVIATLAIFYPAGEAGARPQPRGRRHQPGQPQHGKRPPAGQPDTRGQATAGEPATKALLAGEHLFNECLKIPPNRKVKITLKPDSELHDLIAWISGMTCRKFIVGSNVRAQKVTIYSPTPVTAGEAYRAFLSALNVMGLTVQPSGRYLKIVETRAKGLTTLCVPGRACPDDDRIITRLVRLNHVSPNDVKAVLDGLKSQDGNIITYEPTNVVIITDVARVAAQLTRILRQLDVESEGDRIWVVRMKHAEASEMAQMLQEIFDTAAKGATPQRRPPPRGPKGRPTPAQAAVTAGGSTGVEVSKIIADDRTNLLIIVSDERAFLKIRALIRKLDIPIKGGEERIHVVPLANATAEDMRDTLSGLTGTPAAGRTAGARRQQRGRQQQQQARQAGRGQMVGLFDGEVQITADVPTNSLVVVASMKDFMSLKRVIDQLDVPRRQVFIEASILEVSLSRTRTLGVSFHGGQEIGSGDNKSLLLFGHDASRSITLDPSALTGLALGLRGPELKDAESLLGIPGISFPTFGAFFTALQSNNDVNVISQPHILTTDNEEAVIEVGENVPFQSGLTGMGTLAGMAGQAAGQTGFGLGALPMMSIQRMDVTLKLKLVPHVNDSNFVRLEIEQEMNEVKSIDPTVGPTTTKKMIKTVIVVKDQQTAVLGGLITRKIKKNVTKVPLLGDIPILGYLFKRTTTSQEKSNLLIFLTPYIIRDQSDLRRIFRRKMRQRQEFIERYTMFKDHDLESEIDYRNTRGLLEEINRVAKNAEEEAAMKLKALEESREIDVDGPVTISAEDRKLVTGGAEEGNSPVEEESHEEETEGEE